MNECIIWERVIVLCRRWMHCSVLLYFSDRDKANIHWVERLIDTNTLQAHVVHKYRDSYYFLCGFLALLALWWRVGEHFQSIKFSFNFQELLFLLYFFAWSKSSYPLRDWDVNSIKQNFAFALGYASSNLSFLDSDGVI